MSGSQPPPPPPPPPPGGYGGPPPPGYGAGPPPPSSWRVGDAFSYGWRKFGENVGAFLLAALLILVVSWIAGGLSNLLQAAIFAGSDVDYDPNAGTVEADSFGGWVLVALAGGLSALISLVLTTLVTAGLIRGALGVTEGRRFEVGQMFRSDRLGAVLVTVVLVSLLTAVGIFLCILPGIVVHFLTIYSLYFVLDRGMSPTQAIGASIRFTTRHLGQTLAWYVVGILVLLVGLLLCFVGLLVAAPVVLVGTAYTYKVLTGQPVAR